MVLFEWQKQKYLTYNRIYWPIDGFNRHGDTILSNLQDKTNNVGDRFLTGFTTQFKYGWLTGAFKFNNSLIVLANKAMDFGTYVFILKNMDDKAEDANKNANKTYPLFTEDFLNKNSIRSVLEVPFISKKEQGKLFNVTIFGVATDPKSPDIVTKLISVDQHGNVIHQMPGVNYSTSSAFVYKNNKEKEILEYVVLHNDAYMCFLNRAYEDMSSIHDYETGDNIRMQPNCMPTLTMFGCPQDFCIRNTVDAFVKIQSAAKIIVFRGPYFWLLKNDANKLPLQYPLITTAKMIASDAPFSVSPTYIDAAFSFVRNNKEVTYLFKGRKMYQYTNSKNLVRKNIEAEFGTEVNVVDAAVFIPKEDKLFLFEGEYVHIYKIDFKTDHFTWMPSVPALLAMTHNFSGLPANLDAVLQIDNNAYFVKQNFYYVVDVNNWDTYKTGNRYSAQIAFNNMTNGQIGLFDTPMSCYESEQSKSDILKLLYLNTPVTATNTKRFVWKQIENKSGTNKEKDTGDRREDSHDGDDKGNGDCVKQKHSIIYLLLITVLIISH
ncbi:matrix metalloproteinase-19-like isoform X2 [Leptotrombidium deliense]|uniref:Matrix metalloproteinase-19-like isoform X2 n=1 Tax=Leptotrombidium deliense TaxID=299467 RepID=A0A443SHS9_9ACAR|nr:matrix metalloproteinase-19-like isoform X2 [Leptotrombidium deliense]